MVIRRDVFLAYGFFMAVCGMVLFVALCEVDFRKPRPDRFACPHCGVGLRWSDLGRGYIECRFGWTAAAAAREVVQ